MEAKLRVVDGAKPAVIRLKLPTIIGRSGDATLTIKSSKISRQHCEIDSYEGELTVRDLDSSNGTYINGVRITEVTYLSPGDELKIGPLALIAEYEIEAPSIPEAEPQSAEAKPTEAANSPVPSADQVVDDRPADQSGISSVVHYQENADGSFLGIEELVKSEEASTPTESSPIANATESDGSSAADRIDLGLEQETKVDPGDSQLNKFFDGLS